MVRPAGLVQETPILPKRIQLKRSKGWRMPAGAVKVDRTTKWGNPFIPGQDCRVIPGRKVQDKRHAASLYLGFAPLQAQLVTSAREELKGKDLACWCQLCDLHKDGKPLGSDCPYCARCHADTLLKIANTDLGDVAFEDIGKQAPAVESAFT